MNFFLSILITLTLCLFSCSDRILYERTLSAEEHKEYSRLFTYGSNTYQGSPDNMMVIRESIKLDSTNGDAWRELGIPYLKRGFGIKFDQYYAQARYHDPDPWTGYSGYIYLYFYRDYAKALEMFDAADALTPNFIDYPQAQSIDLMRGICLLKLGQLERAKIMLRKYIDYETETSGRAFVDGRGFLYLGIALVAQENYIEATQIFNQGLDVDRNNAEMLFQLSKINLITKDYQKSLHLLEQCEVQLKNQNQFTRAYVEEFYQVHALDIRSLRSDIAAASGRNKEQ